MQGTEIVAVLTQSFGPLGALLFGEKPKAQDILSSAIAAVANVAKLGYSEVVPPHVIDILTKSAELCAGMGDDNQELAVLMSIAEIVAREAERKKFGIAVKAKEEVIAGAMNEPSVSEETK